LEPELSNPVLSRAMYTAVHGGREKNVSQAKQTLEV